VGYSTDIPEEAAAAVADGADYIGCGAVYATRNKADAGEAIGPEGLDRVARRVEVPVVGIGGIQRENVAAVARTRAAGIAVMGTVMQAPDPEAEVRALLSLLEGRVDPG
jgi:thiamine-phosphate pyrophosphorylase